MSRAAPAWMIVLLGAASAGANDFPTNARVEYVLECLREHPGSEYEFVQKCSCALDRLAERYKYDDFVEAQTMARAVTIAGERGAALRDNEAAQQAARRYRQAVAEAGKACFLH
jgi:hypothetical protein